MMTHLPHQPGERISFCCLVTAKHVTLAAVLLRGPLASLADLVVGPARPPGLFDGLLDVLLDLIADLDLSVEYKREAPIKDKVRRNPA